MEFIVLSAVKTGSEENGTNKPEGVRQQYQLDVNSKRQQT